MRIDRFDGTEYAFLSNFYEHPFVWNHTRYPTAEHAFQAAKTKDTIQQLKITTAKTPAEAKRLGRKCSLRSDWESIKLYTMNVIIDAKFRDPALRKQLLETQDAFLVEGNDWHDNYWGDCFCSRCEKVVGENQLGRCLMMLRAILLPTLLTPKER